MELQHVQSSIQLARHWLLSAERELDTFEHGTEGSQRTLSFWNFISALVATRNALRHAMKAETAFEAAFQSHWQDIESDQLFTCLVRLRNELYHEKPTRIATGMYIRQIVVSPDLMGPAPAPNASMFIGDQLGGSGWEVPQPDGSVEKFYRELPEGSVEIHYQLPERLQPSEHKGEDVSRLGLKEIAHRALSLLQSKTREAGIWHARASVTKAGRSESSKDRVPHLRLLRGGKK
jgi:hypothetical protein